MVIFRMRNKEEHKDLLKKVKKMKEYAEMIEDCLEDVMVDDEEEYRYRDDEDFEEMHRGGGRYSYSRGGGSRGSRM